MSWARKLQGSAWRLVAVALAALASGIAGAAQCAAEKADYFDGGDHVTFSACDLDPACVPRALDASAD